MPIIDVAQLPGISISRSVEESGWRGISITKQYRLETTGPLDLPEDHPDFPSIGDTLDYEGFTLRCRANPILNQDQKYRSFFYASATFDNLGDDAGSDIAEQRALKIWRPVAFKEFVRDAEFLGAFDESLDIITGLEPDGLAVGDLTPIVNSAGIARPKERTFHGRKFTIEQYYQDFSPNWETYQDKTNEDQITISQSDATGEKWSFDFEPRTLLMEDVQIDEERYDNGLIYFKVTWNFTQHPKGWTHYEVDRGRKAKIFSGQYKEDGTTYSQSDLDDFYEGLPGYQEFTFKVLDATGADTGQLATVSEPIKLNGYGHRFDVTSPVSNTAKTIFLGFLPMEEKAWASLNL